MKWHFCTFCFSTVKGYKIARQTMANGPYLSRDAVLCDPLKRLNIVHGEAAKTPDCREPSLRQTIKYWASLI